MADKDDTDKYLHKLEKKIAGKLKKTDKNKKSLRRLLGCLREERAKQVQDGAQQGDGPSVTVTDAATEPDAVKTIDMKEGKQRIHLINSLISKSEEGAKKKERKAKRQTDEDRSRPNSSLNVEDGVIIDEQEETRHQMDLKRLDSSSQRIKMFETFARSSKGKPGQKPATATSTSTTSPMEPLPNDEGEDQLRREALGSLGREGVRRARLPPLPPFLEEAFRGAEGRRERREGKGQEEGMRGRVQEEGRRGRMLEEGRRGRVPRGEEEEEYRDQGAWPSRYPSQADTRGPGGSRLGGSRREESWEGRETRGWRVQEVRGGLRREDGMRERQRWRDRENLREREGWRERELWREGRGDGWEDGWRGGGRRWDEGAFDPPRLPPESPPREVVSYRDRDRVWEELEEREALEGGYWEEAEDPMSEGEEEFAITGCRRANNDG